VIREFTALTDAQLPALNRDLQAKQLPPLPPLQSEPRP
jgi:hypothetical protein